MAYRRYRTRRPIRRRGMRKGRIARIAKRVFDKNTENKLLFTNVNQTVTTGGTMLLLNTIPQGAGTNQRIGSSVRIKFVKFKYEVECGDLVNQFRVMVLWSRAPIVTGNMPSVNGLIDPSKQNYKVLFDRSHRLGDVSVNNTNMPFKAGTSREIYRKVGGFTRFEVDSTTIRGGYLNLYLVSDSVILPNPLIVGQFMVSYQDA